MARKTRTMSPIHPGETLREDFLKPLGVCAAGLAAQLCVPAARIADIAACRRPINADTALRLARYFGTTPELWLSLQTHYDLEVAQDALGTEIDGRIRPHRAA
jgi:addiction module HigA family antidote